MFYDSVIIEYSVLNRKNRSVGVVMGEGDVTNNRFFAEYSLKFYSFSDFV